MRIKWGMVAVAVTVALVILARKHPAAGQVRDLLQLQPGGKDAPISLANRGSFA